MVDWFGASRFPKKETPSCETPRHVEAQSLRQQRDVPPPGCGPISVIKFTSREFHPPKTNFPEP